LSAILRLEVEKSNPILTHLSDSSISYNDTLDGLHRFNEEVSRLKIGLLEVFDVDERIRMCGVVSYVVGRVKL